MRMPDFIDGELIASYNFLSWRVGKPACLVFSGFAAPSWQICRSFIVKESGYGGPKDPYPSQGV